MSAATTGSAVLQHGLQAMLCAVHWVASRCAWAFALDIKKVGTHAAHEMCGWQCCILHARAALVLHHVENTKGTCDATMHVGVTHPTHQQSPEAEGAIEQ